ncbi:MAG TPA: hypothetical protein VFG09_14235, partial [Thermodesulfovibrionales bacterium]|nr:hypothetical protein [Thermodesulfovibrionales bacterium]
SHPVFDFAPEDLEKPHVPEEVQPSSMEEHRSQEGEVVYQWEMTTVAPSIFSGNNSKIIGKFFKGLLREGSFKQENEPAKRYDAPRCNGEAPVGHGVTDWEHIVISLKLISLPGINRPRTRY